MYKALEDALGEQPAIAHGHLYETPTINSDSPRLAAAAGVVV
jgi:hypothetical protein